MKILITGGTTFVSRFTAEYFVKKGDDVTVINRGSREQVAGVTLINCDRTALGDRLRGAHFDLILDITAYTEEHVRTLIESGVSFDDLLRAEKLKWNPLAFLKASARTVSSFRNSLILYSP